ncbi:MAG: hypothetical protein GX887_07540, partial [Firmicutes bacterium]|nr:hypothetical protein [Bacillota bacterium]
MREKWLVSGKIMVLVLVFFFLLIGKPGCYPMTPGNDPSLSADVVVVGGTVAAHVAALEASRNGARVLVFWSGDEEDYPDIVEEGIIARENMVGHEFAVEIPGVPSTGSPDSNIELEGDGGLIGMETERALAAAHWLEKEFKTGFRIEKEGLHYRYAFEKPLLLAEIKENLRQAATKCGVIYFDAVKRLDGGKSGTNWLELQVHTAHCNRISVHTRTIIIADGGFLGNAALMKRLAPGVRGGGFRSGSRAMGLSIAREMEAELTEINTFASFPETYGEKDSKWHRKIPGGSCFMVNEEEVIPLENADIDTLCDLLSSRKNRHNIMVVEEALRQGNDGEEHFVRLNGPEEFEKKYGFEIPVQKQEKAGPTG